MEEVDVYVPHQANKRIIDHAVAKLGIPAEKTVVNVDRYGNTSSGSIPLALADARAEGRLRDGELVLMTGMGAGLTWGSALVEWTRSGRDGERMKRRRARWHSASRARARSRRGMGREVAEAVPEAMEVYRVGSEASGLDLQRLCFDAPLEELVETEVQQPALVTTSLAILAALRERGIKPDVVVGHSVGEFAALASVGAMGTAEAIASRPRARSRDGRGCAPATRARWPPSSVSRTRRSRTCAGRSSACGRPTTTARARSSISGENGAVEECCAEAESLGARRAIRLKVSGAFHSPLVAKAADRLRPAIDKVRFAEPIAPFMSTVTAKIEPAQRLAALLVDQLTAPVKFTQAARELMREGVTTFVEVGPGNVLSGLIKRIDRSVRRSR